MYEVPPTPPVQQPRWRWAWRIAAGSVMFGVGVAGVRLTGPRLLRQIERGWLTDEFNALAFGWSCLLLFGALAYAVAGQRRWARRMFWGLAAASVLIGFILWSFILY